MGTVPDSPATMSPATEPTGAETEPTTVAIACQGGGSHTAFTAGVLRELLANWDSDGESFELVGISGTSGGAFNALAVWYGLVTADAATAIELLDRIWTDIAATEPVDRLVNSWLTGYSWLDSTGAPMPAVSPSYMTGDEWAQRRLARVLERHIDFEAIPELTGETQPELVVGAIDIEGGRFETFTNAGVTVEAVLASAAVPRWFEAVEVEGGRYWDGLLSQNPPITDLLSVPGDRTPEELWVIQVNPQRRAGLPTALSEIDDRRNELAGNISLNQELRFAEWINDKLDSGHFEHPDYRQVDIKRLELSDYPYATKVNRSKRFLDRLTAEGEARAAAFLDDRSAR